MENSENSAKFSNSKEVIAYLCAQFPACFVAQGETKPLKVGIFQDLAARLADDQTVSKTLLRSALRQYTSSWRYLHSLKAGVARVDLDGNLGEILTEEHIEHAKLALKESKDRFFAQKKEAEKAAAPKRNNVKRADVKRAVKSPNSRPAKAAVVETAVETPKMQPVEISTLRIDQSVNVLIGKAPLPATVKEITKDDVQVQLPTGMTLRVKFEHLVI